MKNLIIITCLIFPFLLISCDEQLIENDGTNSIYYWRTTFSLNEAEKDFIEDQNIKKIYLHFFDVVVNDWDGENIEPSATVKINDTVPAGLDIVPTVYITNSAMMDIQVREDEFAEKILKRVNAMCKKNNIAFDELQLDCDWTKSTQKYFYRLCEAIKSRMDSTQTLSSTIRLHQLKQTPPPVDKGVLMVYNTGNLMEMTSDNSIFSYNDIEPYLRDDRLSKYSLPLDISYPTYGWSIVYHPGEDKYCFNRIMRRTNLSDYPGLKKIGPNLYEAEETVCFTEDKDGWDNVYEGYRIRVERPTAKEILRVKNMIDSKLKGKPHNNILYHLDEEQLSHYSNNEISKIYSCN